MNYAQKYNLSPADRIIAPLFQTGITKHHAIYLGLRLLGVEWVAENHVDQGVRIITASRYFAEHPVITRIEKFKGSEYQRQIAINTAYSLEGTQYDLFAYNCEHYANEVQYGQPKSKQVENFFLLLGVLFLGYIITAD